MNSIGFSVAKGGSFDDLCRIVAWAPIEDGKTEPDLDEIKRCGNYWPAEGTPECYLKTIRILSHQKCKTAAEQRMVDRSLSRYKERYKRAKAERAAATAVPAAA